MTQASTAAPGLSLYDRMFYSTLRIRLIEERIAEIYPSDKIQSPVHLSIGQEHISVGVCEAAKRTDLVFGTYRSHALYLAKGGDLNRFVAELYGKRTGCGAGKAGSMHLCDPDVGMMGASAVVASTIPHAVGAALVARLQKTGQVIICFYGEGATGEGVYHESLNFAALHRLPVLFVCENNDLSIYTISSAVHSFRIGDHARSYGIEAESVDEGMDLNRIYEKASQHIEAIRSGGGPRVLEFHTYRYRQHVGPQEDYHLGYRERTDLESWLARDPVVQDKERIARFRPDIERELNAAIEFAENSPFPGSEDLYKDLV